MTLNVVNQKKKHLVTQQHCLIHDIVSVDVLVDNLINDDDYSNNEDDKQLKI